ncbi:hypothetical protein IY888_06540, partial [Campylobacter volucris]|nr:hypothetical protein [Campylobacter volucris]
MKVLLVNSNVAVSKLVSLGVQKLGYDFEEIANIEGELSHYDIIIVDHDSDVDLNELKTKCDRLIYLLPRNQEKKEDIECLHKPFLPTDFIELLGGIKEFSEIDQKQSNDDLDEQLLSFDEDKILEDDELLDTDELLKDLNL